MKVVKKKVKLFGRQKKVAEKMLFSCNLFASSHSLIWFVCGTRVAPAWHLHGL